VSLPETSSSSLEGVLPVGDLMVWTPEQARALDMCGRWLKSDEQVFRLFGYAGTGKTTIARHLAATSDGMTLYAAYTGKAAHVMRSTGCTGATTLHSILYKPTSVGTGKIDELVRRIADPTTDPADMPELNYDLRQAREAATRPTFALNPDSSLKWANLLVVDEVSMVNEDMARDILSFGKKVLVLGDPAQLPPVQGEGAFTSREPNILLTDIQRQAKDNAIIRWATKVREGGLIEFGNEGAARKLRKTAISTEDLIHRGGQLLTGKNETRRKLNMTARKMMGASGPYPNKGESLVCLKNDHKAGLLNGVTCVAAADAKIYEGESLTMDIYYEGYEMIDLDVSTQPFDVYNEPELTLNEWERRRYQLFDYGYCLTVHKAQGSQWDKVTVCDDGFGKRGGAGSQDRARWLYTAITRAQRELVIVA
jgi:exodeoxyribonuclease-5